MPNGDPILTQEYINSLQQQAITKKLRNAIVPQAGGQENMLATDVDILICGGSRGGPLLVDTRVVTPFGYRRIGDLKAGDIISGTDGGMQRVIYRKDHGKLPAYKLKFVDGSEVIASYDHLWNVRKTCYRSKKRVMNGLSLEDDYRVWTTQMIVDHLKKVESGEIKNSRLVIPVCEPVKFTNGHSRYGIDPYHLGVILGDGCITDAIIKYNNVMFTSADKEIVDSFAERYTDIHSRTKYKPIDYIFKSPEFVDALKKMKLAGHRAENKFVPKTFLFGTVEERFALLQGLMDTDGSVDKRGHVSFTSVSEQLAKDVKFLVNSLGGLATITKNETGYKKDGVKIKCKDAYIVYIRIKDSARLFRLDRKKKLCTEYNGGISEVARHIVGYEYLGEQEVCCIAVDNKNSLFMVEDFIVTHNSKSFSLLMEALKDIKNPDFHAAVFRGNKKAMEKLIRDSRKLYSQFGYYNKSESMMTWNFNSGGTLSFFYHDDSDDDFKERFQGQEYAYIAIDEITHISYKKFKYLTTCNRNAYGIRNRFWGTCNPDPRSWVRQFIDWWVDKDGYIDPAKDGKVRYCFMKGDRVSKIVWGDSKQEVYEKCKEAIDLAWAPKYEAWGLDKIETMVQSVAFVRADLSQNPMLLLADPTYLARLAAQDDGQVLRDLKANWNAAEAGDDMISDEDLEKVFTNPYQYGDGIRRCTADIALEGGDNLVMYLWIGWHVADFRCVNVNSKTAVSVIKRTLKEWGVAEENFCYDYQGLGQLVKGFFPEAIPFNNQAAPIAEDDEEADGVKYLYKDLKSQCAYIIYRKLKELDISFEENLLDRKVSGNGYDDIPLREVLQKERQSLRRDTDSQDKGFCLMPKKKSKLIVGHSPDWWESLYFRAYFDLAEPMNLDIENSWMMGADYEIDFDEEF